MNASESGNCAADQNMTSTPHGFAVLWEPVISALLAAAVVANVVYKSSVERGKLPPGPHPWPIIGNFPSLIGFLPHRTLYKLTQKFGGLMYLRLGSVPCLVISSAGVAKEVLKTHDLALSDRPEGLFSEILSNYRSIVFSPSGAYWRHLRKICASEIFRPARIASYKDDRLEEIRVSVKEMLEDSNRGEAINLHLWVQIMIFNMMARMVLNKRRFVQSSTCMHERDLKDLPRAVASPRGSKNHGKSEGKCFTRSKLCNKRLSMFCVKRNNRCKKKLANLWRDDFWERRDFQEIPLYFTKDEASQQEAREYNKVVDEIFKQGVTLVISDFLPFLSFIPKWLGQEKAIQNTTKNVLHILRRMTRLDYRRKCMEEGKSNDHAPPDFVDIMLSMPSETGEECLSDDTILLLSMDLLVAGIDSTGTAIEWALVEMLRNPQIMKQAQAELDFVVGSKHLVQESDLENLPYLQAVLKETYRMHTAAPLSFGRQSTQPFTVQGYTFPTKTRVFFNQWAVHRDPSMYDNPEEFDPSRFLKHPEVNTGGGHYQLLPFGTGRRICLGMPLATQMIAIVLAHLVHSFNWCLPHGEDPKNLDVSEVFGIFNSKRTTLYVIPKPRQSALLY